MEEERDEGWKMLKEYEVCYDTDRLGRLAGTATLVLH